MEDELWGLRVLQKQELNKVGFDPRWSSGLYDEAVASESRTSRFFSFQIQSNLGKIILKEELGKSAGPLRRKTRSLPDRSHNSGTNTNTPSQEAAVGVHSPDGRGGLHVLGFLAGPRQVLGSPSGRPLGSWSGPGPCF